MEYTLFDLLFSVVIHRVNVASIFAAARPSSTVSLKPSNTPTPTPINRTLRFSDTNTTLQFVTTSSNHSQPSLSVVVPEAYNDTISLSSSPLPGRISVTSNRTADDCSRITIDEEEEEVDSAVQVIPNMDSGEAQETNAAAEVQSEQEFKCLVQQDDGHTIPAKIYSG